MVYIILPPFPQIYIIINSKFNNLIIITGKVYNINYY